MTTEKNNALLLVVSAPSGAGKSTICNRLVETFPDMIYSVSCTTRAPRGEEKDGEHYHFLSRDEFINRVNAGEFLEHAEVHGNLYGTLESTVRRALDEGCDLIMDIDVQGAAQIRAACAALSEDDPLRKRFVDIFIAPPSLEELERRLRGRATDCEEVIQKRMFNAMKEMEQKDDYAHLIINDNLDVAFEKFVNVVCMERQKRD
ncbi:guanylate kinase [Tichowtungia aerotolerans]|uniref:Guanylate kinase n=1 Tax=Tichowtungia aerotolerans TaxID=2697043 RepID=A0A6P1M754_9BACT|nr:guanylate kinase [Tichowtungia aerotolerans]QHI68863.1 guanylate kinase [Tichowtungia aerotolerans]